MGRMGGVLHDTVGFAGALCKGNVQDGGERYELCSLSAVGSCSLQHYSSLTRQ